MKRVMIVDRTDFIEDENGIIHPRLGDLKQTARKAEVDFDIVAYFENDKLILFKNRYGEIGEVALNPEVSSLLLQK